MKGVSVKLMYICMQSGMTVSQTLLDLIKLRSMNIWETT